MRLAAPVRCKYYSNMIFIWTFVRREAHIAVYSEKALFRLEHRCVRVYIGHGRRPLTHKLLCLLFNGVILRFICHKPLTVIILIEPLYKIKNVFCIHTIINNYVLQNCKKNFIFDIIFHKTIKIIIKET